MSERELERILQEEADEVKVQEAINKYLKGEQFFYGKERHTGYFRLLYF